MEKNNNIIMQVLQSACLNCSDDESEDEDIIENTPAGSPQNNFKVPSCVPVVSASHQIGERIIEASPFFPLTPKQIDQIGERSIEAPPYSPLTPKQISQIGEKSIEAPPYSPLTPSQKTVNQRTVGSPLSTSSSPLPPMSPKTAKVYNMLLGTEDSDDSVKDPDYEADDDDSSSIDDSLEENEDDCQVREQSSNKIKRNDDFYGSTSLLPLEHRCERNEQNLNTVVNSVQKKRKVTGTFEQNDNNDDSIDDSSDNENTIFNICEPRKKLKKNEGDHVLISLTSTNNRDTQNEQDLQVNSNKENVKVNGDEECEQNPNEIRYEQNEQNFKENKDEENKPNLEQREHDASMSLLTQNEDDTISLPSENRNEQNLEEFDNVSRSLLMVNEDDTISLPSENRNEQNLEECDNVSMSLLKENEGDTVSLPLENIDKQKEHNLEENRDEINLEENRNIQNEQNLEENRNEENEQNLELNRNQQNEQILEESTDQQNEQNLDENREQQIEQNLEGLPRKRKVRDPSKWRVNIEKQKRLKGEPYKTKKGIDKQARPLKQANCATLSKHKCVNLVPEDERVKIYNEFRNLSSLQDQRTFVVNHVTKKNKNRDTTQGLSRRKFTQVYTLTVSGEKKVVCRQFFLNTLNITGAFVKGALKKLNSEGILLPEKRGRKAPPNKLSESCEKHIRDHILSFPSVDSHYCRRDSIVKYLDCNLNITTMYTEYKKECEKNQMKPACFEKYRLIFREYKLSFHKPKKDLCKRCLAYKEMNNEEKNENEEAYSMHLMRRDAARKCRDEDKEEARNDEKTLSFNFDLEAVLSTPKGAAGPFFYVRKLAVYNLTIYNLGNQDVQCFLWDETQGKRGSVEISTCVNKYIMGKENITQVKMMSDGCGGQQKNYHFSSMCLVTVAQHPTLQKIEHKFFESGHTHMECDSIHSKIEKKSKHVPVYVPDGWTQIVRMARTNPRPFIATNLLHDDFEDFGTRNQFQPHISEDGRKVGLNDAVWLEYRKEAPNTIFMKQSYDEEEEFIALKLKRRRGKTANSQPQPVTAAYPQRLKISSSKKKDLLKLCTDLQIPREHHSFYNDIPSSEAVRDALAEPDIEEDSE